MRGATCMAFTKRGVGYFNSRTRVGCNNSDTQRDKLLDDFNSRTHIGCDQMIWYSCRAR